MLPVVHIGYARTGSTWLQQVVFPQMAGVSNAWDVGVWPELSWRLAVRDDDMFFDGTLRAFVDDFAEHHPGTTPVFSQEMIAGHWLTPGDTATRNLRRVQKVFAEARILLVVRRQDTVLPALYGLYTRTGGHRPLSDVLRSQEVEGWPWNAAYFEYDVVADLYAEAYGRENLFVIPYELSRTDPDAFLDELLAICGGEGFHDREALRHDVNASFSPPTAYLYRKWNRLFVQSKFNSQPLLGARSSGVRAHQVLAERIDPVLRHLDWPWPTSDDRDWLQEFAAGYAESNARLQRYCTHSLASLGYAMPESGSRMSR